MKKKCRGMCKPTTSGWKIFRTPKLLFIAILFATLTDMCFCHAIHSQDQITNEPSPVVDTHVTKENRSIEELTFSLSSGEDPDPITQERRNKTREMTQHAWNNYGRHAWGKNEVRPLSKRPHFGGVFGNNDIGATIIDAVDTLYIMGLKDEYQKGRDWIAGNFSFKDVNADLSVFETNIRFVGGLLSMYAFTGDEMYKTKAQEVADRLLPAFETATGIPKALVNIRTGHSQNYYWASGSILSEIGSLHLEFSYLSDITGDAVYRERVMNVRQKLRDSGKPNGLYPNFIEPDSGKWGQRHFSLGAFGDSFYEYLLKAWIQSDKTDSTARQMYDDAMKAIVDNMIKTSSGGLVYVSDMKCNQLNHKMGHLACFAGGLFALGAATQNDENTDKYMRIGKGITNTCHESYIRTPTHLGPEEFGFHEGAEAKSSPGQDRYYILRPEVLESYFILWRLTHDQKYRDWGWDALQAIEKHCRTTDGFSGIANVNSNYTTHDDVQQSFFLAESLKYLYLLFSDDSLLPLDEWVFNTEAHPLPIKGKPWYRADVSQQTLEAAEANLVAQITSSDAPALELEFTLCLEIGLKGICHDYTILATQNCIDILQEGGKSINTHGNCVRIYKKLNCTGGFEDVEPGSCFHNNLARLGYEGSINSVGRCH